MIDADDTDESWQANATAAAAARIRSGEASCFGRILAEESFRANPLLVRTRIARHHCEFTPPCPNCFWRKDFPNL